MKRWLTLGTLFVGAVPAFGGTCLSLSVTNMPFGSYSGAAISLTATVTVNCTSGYAFTLGIGGGDSANASARYMVYATGITLNYNLYKDAAHTTIWGNNNGVTTISGVGTGANQTYTVYGLLPAGEYNNPVSYGDNPIVYVQGGSFVYLNVSATVASTCQVSASDLAFGINTGLASANSTLTASVLCTNATPYNLEVNFGLNSGGTTYNWKMAGPAGQYLSYRIYQDSARTVLWGVTPGTDSIAGTGTGSTQTVTGYGQIPTSQYPSPGSYSDTVTMTVAY